MNDIRALIQAASTRLGVDSYIAKASLATAVFASMAAILVGIEKMTPAFEVPWMWFGPVLLVLALATAFALWLRSRESELQVAMLVDDRLDLRERLSTALHCRDRNDAFAQAAVDDAVTAAREESNREKLKRKFPISPPPGWWAAPLLVLAALMLSLLPQGDLFSREKENPAEIQQAVNESDDAIEEIVREIAKNEDLQKVLADSMPELTEDGLNGDKVKNPDEIRRDAIKKATKLNKKLDELLAGEKAKTLEALKKQLNDLKSPNDGATKELTDSLAKGDFNGASKALKKLQEEIAAGDMSEKKKEEIARSLEEIAEKLEKASKKQKQLEDSLKKAGMDPQLAQNPEALKQAIENNENLNQQQKQQLKQQAAAQQAASKMCKAMGGAAGKMAQAMQQQGRMGQAGKQMGEMLNDAEALQQMLQQARAAAKACEGQCQGLGQGLAQQWQQMQKMARGGAFGTRGQGRGGNWKLAPTPTGTKDVKEKVKNTGGDIIARQYIEGAPIVGEAKSQLSKVLNAEGGGFEEALSDDQIPPKYRDVQKHYFGELQKRMKTNQGEDSSDSEKKKK